MTSPRTIVEIREAGDVRAAAVVGRHGRRLEVLTVDGQRLNVTPQRILHDAGVPAAESDTEERILEGLRDFEAEAQRRACDVDLAELHAFLRETGAAEGLDLDALALDDLAPLALGDSSPLARAGVHRALAASNAWFRFDGRSWRALAPEEVEREQEKIAAERRLAEERTAFLEAARRRLAGSDETLPAFAEKFLRPLRELAIDASGVSAKEAAIVLDELQPGRRATPANAFDVLETLGIFSRDENLAVLRSGIATRFPAEVLEEASELAIVPWDGEHRLDLRGLEIVTIDDAKTVEIDDGLSLESTATGLRLGIHIADASHFVPPGSLVDQEAHARATSHYLPEGAIPMLPAVIAEDAASLVAGRDRPALSFLVELTPHGEILRSDIKPSIVRVTHRLTFDDCEAVLEGGREQLAWLRKVAEIRQHLEAERLASGATPMVSPEVSIAFDEASEPVVTLVDPSRPARQLVSETMILANRLAAEWCRDRGLPAVYRRQAPASGDVEPPPRDRHDPVAIDRYRRCLQRTEIGLEPGPHASLGLPAYVQATSPIRRYQDLVLHRVVKAACWGMPSPCSREEVQAVAASTEQAGRQARRIEQESQAYWILRHLESRVGDVLAAVIVRPEGRRTHVFLRDVAHPATLPARPDHEAGASISVRVRSVRPREGSLTLEQLD